MPEISIIVPVYNVEQYLCECIDSILAQIFEDYELILVDDGSPDRCGQICDEYAALDDRVRVIHQENAGVSFARNIGIDIARGNYISFVDSDDIISAFYLKELYEKIIEYQADISICEMKEFDEKNTFKMNRDSDIKSIKKKVLSGKEAALTVYSQKREKISVGPCAKLYKKSLFEEVRFPINKRYEDDATVPILLQKSKKVIWFKLQLYGYRQRTDSFMHEKFSLKKYDSIDAINRCINYFNEIQESELATAAINHRDALIAYYALLSRKAGMYQDIQKEYRMGRIKAVRTMKSLLPYNLYSYRMASISPRYIFIETHIRKLLQMFGVVKS